MFICWHGQEALEKRWFTDATIEEALREIFIELSGKEVSSEEIEIVEVEERENDLSKFQVGNQEYGFIDLYLED